MCRVSGTHSRVMADYDDIAAPLLDAEVHELLEETSLEELERVRDRYFGGRDSHGPISRAIN